MKFISKRYVVKIPSEIFVLYCKKKSQLLISDKTKKIIIDLKVKLKILKKNNCIIITEIPVEHVSNKFKKIKRSLQGLTYFLIKKLIKNFKTTSCKKLNLIGIGYKVFEVNSKKSKYKLLHFKLGYSHNIYYKIPESLNIQIRQSNKLFISGSDTNLVSTSASTIKDYKLPEPYKGKGILYFNETIKLKEGKKI